MTKRVRIAVAINKNGDWCAAGYSDKDKISGKSDDDSMAEIARENVEDCGLIVFVWADIPIPNSDVEGTVLGTVVGSMIESPSGFYGTSAIGIKATSSSLEGISPSPVGVFSGMEATSKSDEVKIMFPKLDEVSVGAYSGSIRTSIVEGNRIAVIKAVRKKMSWMLSDAKNWVENHWDELKNYALPF